MDENHKRQLKKLKRDWRRIFSGEAPDRTIRIVPIKTNRHEIRAEVNEMHYYS